MRPPALPPVLLALAAQAAAFGLTLAVARSGGLHLAPLAWLAVDASVAALLGRVLGLAWWWMPLNFALPWMAHGAAVAGLPGGVYLGGLAGLALVFGGGLLTRVPLYNANRAAWRALERRVPEEAASLIDLGCGLGGPLAHLARTRPALRLVGVEASPLTFCIAWLRCLPHPQVRIRFGSLWAADLRDFDVAYAFLSPVPMPRLWEKAKAEMRPGTLLLSHTFAVPGQAEDWKEPLSGRADACLRGWTM